MQSLVKSSKILMRNKKCVSKIMVRSVRLLPLVIDMSPNYYKTIDIKLNELNYYENAKHLTNIGFKDDSDLKQKFDSIQKLIKNKCEAKEESEDIDSDEEVKHELNYSQIYDKWLLSEEGIKCVIDLANHYSIFSHLFPPLPPIPPKSPIEDIPPKPIYYFSPLVPINVEFCVNESEIVANDESVENMSQNKSNDIIVSRVFRGNLLYSKNCRNAPNVVIDCSAINEINTFDNNNKVEENAEESSGRIKLLNDDQNYYTLALINLDSHFGNESNVCHWLQTNIHNKNSVTNSETVIKYLPIYGIKGLGYHRFVFVLYQHNRPLNMEQINDFVLENRKFDAFKFMTSHGSDLKLTPIGISWFQTVWDYSSQKVLHDFLGIYFV